MSVSLKALIERLTPIARRAVEQAASRALARTHFEVEIEHVLLALLDQEDNAARAALYALDLDPARLMRELEDAVAGFRSGNSRNPVLSSWLPQWFEKAWVLASMEFAQTRVSSLDLLLALGRDGALRQALQESAPSVLRLDMNSLVVAYRTLRAHGGEDAGDGALERAGAVAPTPPGAAPGGLRGTPGLDQYTVDLTAQARAGRIDPILGRDVEIRQMIDILMRRRQNNPILTGEPGVGKTAVVEGLARKIVFGEVPGVLQGVQLRTLDLGLLQAGASVKGEFENRLRQVIDEVKASPVPIILFIDEAHTMIGAGGAAGQNDAANLLKPALARGELRTIAATTWAEYKKYFEKDAALARRFQVVKVEEPAPELAVQMVRGLLEPMQTHHGVEILDEAVRAAVHLSSRYIAGRQLPDKAISVLDTACARVALSRAGRPGPVEDVEALLANLKRERTALQQETGHGERLAELGQREALLEQDLARLQAEWKSQQTVVEELAALRARRQEGPDDASLGLRLQERREALRALQRTQPLAYECVDEHVIADVIAGWTGIPLGRMVSNELGQVRQLATLLAGRVIGQDHALEQIAERVRIAKAKLEDPGKPKGVFLLVGPSGVGKTETALALAETLYGGERNLITINMSEYQEAHTVSGLKGSPPGYVGYGEGGVLTEAVRRKPYSVVLLDEVEKAHPDVMELFFQVFDKGVLEDSEGREVDFRNTIILLTSNAGSELVMAAWEHGVSVEGVSRPPTPADLVDILRPTLHRVFKPAFLGRLDVVPYFPIGEDALRAIVALKLERIRARIAANHGARVHFPEALGEAVVARCLDVESGARNADAILTRGLLASISAELLGHMAEGREVRDIAVALEDGDIRVSLS
jgi:type VI secretion system protein VasG